MSSTYIAGSISDADKFLPHLFISDEVKDATMSATNASATSIAVQTMTTYSRWTPSVGATITATFSGAKAIDYAAIYVTASAGTYTLEWYNGSSWAAIGSALSRTGAGCVAWVFASVSASAIRIVCSSTPSIAVFKAGARTKIPVGIGVGYEPSLYNPTEKLTNTISVTGQILGTQIESARIEESLTFDVIDPDWIASNWMTIRNLMRTVGVFFAWNLKDFSDHVIYGAVVGDPSASFSQIDAMKVSMRLEGPKHVV